MTRSILTCSFILFATILFAQNTETDEMSLKAIKSQQEAAWNRHDWDAFTSYFSYDATLINFVGQYWKGNREITEHLKLLNDCCLSPTSLKFAVKDITFLSPEIAVVYTEESLFADKDYDVPFHQYKKGDVDYKMLTDIFVKQNGEWKITASQLTLINQLISPHIPADEK